MYVHQRITWHRLHKRIRLVSYRLTSFPNMFSFHVYHFLNTVIRSTFLEFQAALRQHRLSLIIVFIPVHFVLSSVRIEILEGTFKRKCKLIMPAILKRGALQQFSNIFGTFHSHSYGGIVLINQAPKIDRDIGDSLPISLFIFCLLEKCTEDESFISQSSQCVMLKKLLINWLA